MSCIKLHAFALVPSCNMLRCSNVHLEMFCFVRGLHVLQDEWRSRLAKLPSYDPQALQALRHNSHQDVGGARQVMLILMPVIF